MVQNNLYIEKIIFKVVQIKFLAMHITYKKLKYLQGTWSLPNGLTIFGIFGIKMYNFDP